MDNLVLKNDAEQWALSNNDGVHPYASNEIDEEITGEEGSFALYMRDLPKIKLLTAEEEKELGRRVMEGDLASRNELVERNLRLVIMIAKKYKKSGVPMSDLVQYGNTGLIKAADMFDYRKGFRFSTYATWWIHQSIRRSIHVESRLIRLPIHTILRIDKIKKVASAYKSLHGNMPSEKQLAEILGLTEKQVSFCIEKNRDIDSLDREIASTDVSDDIHLSDALAAPDNVEDEAINAYQRELINKTLSKALNDRERYVIEHRLGLYGGNPQTLDIIGRHLHISRERVRQIQKIAMNKLRKYKKELECLI